MAIAAQELIQAVGIGLKRQFGNFGATFGALPITLEHLPLETRAAAVIIETSAAIVVRIHFD